MLEVVQLGVSWLVHPVHGSGPGPDVQIVVGDVVDIVTVGRGGSVVVAWTVLLKVGENLTNTKTSKTRFYKLPAAR